MRIIERGERPNPEWVGRFTCDECGTIADIERSDSDALHDWNKTLDGKGVWIAIDCEVCDKLTRWVKVKDTPPNTMLCTCDAPPDVGFCDCGQGKPAAPETNAHGAVLARD